MNTTKFYGFKAQPELVEKFKKVAKQEDMSMSYLIRRLMRGKIKQYERWEAEQQKAS